MSVVPTLLWHRDQNALSTNAQEMVQRRCSGPVAVSAQVIRELSEGKAAVGTSAANIFGSPTRGSSASGQTSGRPAEGAIPSTSSSQTSGEPTSDEIPRTTQPEGTSTNPPDEPGLLDRALSAGAQFLSNLTWNLDANGLSIGLGNNGSAHFGMPSFGPAHEETGSLIGGGTGRFTGDPNSVVDYTKFLGLPSDFHSRAELGRFLDVRGTPGSSEFNTNLLGRLRQQARDI